MESEVNFEGSSLDSDTSPRSRKRTSRAAQYTSRATILRYKSSGLSSALFRQFPLLILESSLSLVSSVRQGKGRSLTHQEDYSYRTVSLISRNDIYPFVDRGFSSFLQLRLPLPSRLFPSSSPNALHHVSVAPLRRSPSDSRNGRRQRQTTRKLSLLVV